MMIYLYFILKKAECDGRLNMLMSEERRDLDNYGFNSSHTPRARSRRQISKFKSQLNL